MIRMVIAGLCLAALIVADSLALRHEQAVRTAVTQIDSPTRDVASVQAYSVALPTVTIRRVAKVFAVALTMIAAVGLSAKIARWVPVRELWVISCLGLGGSALLAVVFDLVADGAEHSYGIHFGFLASERLIALLDVFSIISPILLIVTGPFRDDNTDESGWF